MSTFHSTALSRALNEALDTITSDPSWIKITQPNDPTVTAQATNRRSLISKALALHPLSPPRPLPPERCGRPSIEDVRKTFDNQHAKCLELIAAIDAYASAWRLLELLNLSRYGLKGDLATALDDVIEQSNEVMFDLRRLLNTSLQTYGKVVSRHALPTDFYQRCVLSLRVDRVVVDRGKNYCFHHPLDGFTTDVHAEARLSYIRYSTSIARFLLVVFQYADKYANRAEIEVDDSVTAEWHRQMDTIEDLDARQRILQGWVIQERARSFVPGASSQKPYITHHEFFDNIVLSHNHPLPLAAFVSKYLEFTGERLSNRGIRSRARDYDVADIPDDIRPISSLITEIRGDSDGNNAHFLQRLHDLREAHEKLIKKTRDLVSEMATTTTARTTSDGRSYGTTTIEAGANAVLGDVVHNYIFGSSENMVGTSAQHQQQERPGYPATRNGIVPVPNALFGPTDGPDFPLRLQPTDSHGPSQNTPQSSTAASFVRSLFSTDFPSASDTGTNLSGNHSATNPQRQDPHVGPGASSSYAASVPHYLATQSTHTTSSPEPSTAKMDAANLDHDPMADRVPPPAYTPSHNSKVQPQSDTKATASDRLSSSTPTQQLSDHSSRSPNARSSTRTIPRRPINTSTISENAPMIPHATDVLFSDYFESIARFPRTA